MYTGRRILYNNKNGNIILDFGEMRGSEQRESIEDLSFVDYEFGYKKEEFNNAIRYHIDVENKIPIFDEFKSITPTPEQQRIQELENQLLIEKDKSIGGIL